MIKAKCVCCKKEIYRKAALLIGPPREDNYCKKQHLCRKCYKNILPIIENLGKLIGKEWDIIYRGNSFMGVCYYYTDKHQEREYKGFKCKTFCEVLKRLARSVNGRPEDC